MQQKKKRESEAKGTDTDEGMIEGDKQHKKTNEREKWAEKIGGQADMLAEVAKESERGVGMR